MHLRIRQILTDPSGGTVRAVAKLPFVHALCMHSACGIPHTNEYSTKIPADKPLRVKYFVAPMPRHPRTALGVTRYAILIRGRVVRGGRVTVAHPK